MEKKEMAMKNDAADGKVGHRYLHPRFKKETSLAMEAGAIKYKAFNYLKGHTTLQLLDALERHLDLYRWGQDNDQDCSERLGRPVSHLGNMAACINMLLAQIEEGTITDDRYKKESK
jgi:Domain of unknown function (DUF5664)